MWFFVVAAPSQNTLNKLYYDHTPTTISHQLSHCPVISPWKRWRFEQTTGVERQLKATSITSPTVRGNFITKHLHERYPSTKMLCPMSAPVLGFQQFQQNKNTQALPRVSRHISQCSGNLLVRLWHSNIILRQECGLI